MFASSMKTGDEHRNKKKDPETDIKDFISTIGTNFGEE